MQAMQDVFNVDMTGLPSRLLPRRTYVVPSKKREIVRGTKDMAAKDDVTMYACTYATGSAKVPI